MRPPTDKQSSIRQDFTASKGLMRHLSHCAIRYGYSSISETVRHILTEHMVNYRCPSRGAVKGQLRGSRGAVKGQLRGIQEQFLNPKSLNSLKTHSKLHTTASKRKPVKKLLNPEYLKLSVFLQMRILQNNPQALLPAGVEHKWADVVRLMVERDGHTLETIKAVVEFSQSDEFWRQNILSMGTLRAKWNQLTAKMQRPADRVEQDLEVLRQFAQKAT